MTTLNIHRLFTSALYDAPEETEKQERENQYEIGEVEDADRDHVMADVASNNGLNANEGGQQPQQQQQQRQEIGPGAEDENSIRPVAGVTAYRRLVAVLTAILDGHSSLSADEPQRTGRHQRHGLG